MRARVAARVYGFSAGVPEISSRNYSRDRRNSRNDHRTHGTVQCIEHGACNSVSAGWSTAHSSRRNIQGGNHGSTGGRREKNQEEKQDEGKKPKRRRRTTRVQGTNERTRGNRGACTNGELLFAGLRSWPVGPSFVHPAYPL